jgi:sulfopyruvate decarboxylase subunit alpha
MTPAATHGARIVEALRAAKIDLVATLPDAWLGPAISAIEAAPDMTLMRVTREDEAVAICAGAWLGGRRGAVLAQNAGLLLSTNVLAAYALHHQIPILLLIAQRGRHDDDQYYQSYKGQVTVPVVEAIGLPYRIIEDPADIGAIAQVWMQAYLARRPGVVLLSRRALVGTAP